MHLDEKNDIKLPLEKEIVVKLFGWLSINAEIPKNTHETSYTTIAQRVYNNKRKFDEIDDVNDDDNM